jgi:hypothetical protein
MLVLCKSGACTLMGVRRVYVGGVRRMYFYPGIEGVRRMYSPYRYKTLSREIRPTAAQPSAPQTAPQQGTGPNRSLSCNTSAVGFRGGSRRRRRFPAHWPGVADRSCTNGPRAGHSYTNDCYRLSAEGSQLILNQVYVSEIVVIVSLLIGIDPCYSGSGNIWVTRHGFLHRMELSPEHREKVSAGLRAAWARRKRDKRVSKSSITEHVDCARIERDLALGRPLRVIAKKYGVSIAAAHRHKKRLPPQLRAALAAHALKPGEDLEKLRISESEGILGNLAAQRARLLISQDAAMEAEQYGLVAQLASGVHRNVELTGKYLGEFAAHSTQTVISILLTPEYLDLRAALLRALQPYQEARAAVAAALHQVEERASQRPPQRILDVTPKHVDEGQHAG